MLIKLWIEDVENETKLEDLGTCVTDNPSRAAALYDDDVTTWCDRGYAASLSWSVISDN